MTAPVVVERSTLTVTEALADIKTLVKRIEKKRQSTYGVLARQYGLRDPMERSGGSIEFIRAERQGIKDLEERLVGLRVAIQELNQREEITIDGETRTIASWLTWRKEVLPGQRLYLDNLRAKLEQVRREAAQKQVGVVNVNQQTADTKLSDLLINIDEGQLAREIEHLEHVVGTLDGQLSLKNATTTISI